MLCVWSSRYYEVSAQVFSNMKLSSSEKVPPTCDEFSNLHVIGFPQEADQRRYAIAVLDCHFVFVVLAVRDVAQGTASLPMNLRFGMIQKTHQDRNSFQLAYVLFNLVIFVAQVLQVGSGVGLDGVDGVAEHCNDFGEIGVPPTWVFTDTVDGGRAPPGHSVQASHASSLRLSQWGWIHAMDVRMALINQLCLNGVIWVSSTRPKRRVVMTYPRREHQDEY